MKIWLLEFFENRYDSTVQVVAIWNEFPQLGHLDDVLLECELTVQERIKLLDNYSVEDALHNNWSLIETKPGVRLI